MDTALANGDFKPGSNGLPKKIDGTAELFQRAMIRLSVPLGTFSYLPMLGSRLRGLNPNSADFSVRATAAAQEALRQLPAVTATGVRSLGGTPAGAAVSLLCGGESAEIEVKL